MVWWVEQSTIIATHHFQYSTNWDVTESKGQRAVKSTPGMDKEVQSTAKGKEEAGRTRWKAEKKERRKEGGGK